MPNKEPRASTGKMRPPKGSTLRSRQSRQSGWGRSRPRAGDVTLLGSFRYSTVAVGGKYRSQIYPKGVNAT
jgi:hypothetical protein